MAHPELGYKEVRTSNLVKQAFSKLNLEIQDGLGITGVSGVLPSGKTGQTYALWENLTPLYVRATQTQTL